MARRDQRQQAGKIRAQAPVRLDHDGLLAGMGGCRRDHRPAADRVRQGRELGGIGGGAGTSSLRVAGGDDARRAQFTEALGVGRRAREAEVEALQQIGDRVRQIAPAPERVFRQPAIDQDHRHAAPRRLDHHVRPQIGFHEQRQIGLPVIEEAAHEARHIERHELMDDAARQPLLGQPARGDGAGGHQHVDAARADALDQAAARSPVRRRWRHAARPADPAAARCGLRRAVRSRARCSLPRLSRRASSSGANGVAAADNSR